MDQKVPIWWRTSTALRRLGDVYSDHAISGFISLRPGYQKLLEDARCGRLDVLVAEALDRLSRAQENFAGLFKQLSFAGVRLITLAEGEIDELHVGLKGTMIASSSNEAPTSASLSARSEGRPPRSASSTSPRSSG